MNNTLSISARPTKFEQVLGCEKIVSALKSQIADQRMPVAVMFSGPTGTGKTTLAHILAYYAQGDLPDDVMPEIIEINAADTNGVADMRALVESTQYEPMTGRYRVVILDEAQQLTEPAQNVLLRPLEKPQSSTLWVFCTTSPHKIIKEIKGRCLHFHLTGLDPASREKLVKRVTNGRPIDVPKILEALDRADVTYPRAILMTVEKVLAGIPPSEAVENLEEQPEYLDIIRILMSGNWEKTRAAAGVLKSKDVSAFRSTLAGYLNSMMLRSESIPRNAEAISTLLKGLGVYHAYEDSVSLGAVTALMYDFCKKVSQ